MLALPFGSPEASSPPLTNLPEDQHHRLSGHQPAAGRRLPARIFPHVSFAGGDDCRSASTPAPIIPWASSSIASFPCTRFPSYLRHGPPHQLGDERASRTLFRSSTSSRSRADWHGCRSCASAGPRIPHRQSDAPLLKKLPSEYMRGFTTPRNLEATNSGCWRPRSKPSMPKPSSCSLPIGRTGILTFPEKSPGYPSSASSQRNILGETARKLFRLEAAPARSSISRPCL